MYVSVFVVEFCKFWFRSCECFTESYYTLFADIEPETKRSILADLKLLPLMLESSIFPLQFIHLILSKHNISLHFSFLCLFFVLLYICLKLSIII